MIASVTAARERVAVLFLGTAAAYGVLAQGGYYGPQAVTLVILVVLAAATALPGLRRLPRPPAVAAVCWLLLGLWSLTRGVLGSDAAAAIPTAAFACCLVGAAIAAAGLSSDARRVLLAVVLATSVVVATSCWVGVALHLEPLALPSSGLWRGASTITYPNATAAFLVIALVLVVVLRPLPTGRAENGLTALLLLALATTLSRAGALAVVVACVVAVALRGRSARARLRDLAPSMTAALVAFAGVLPALPVGSPPRPLPALAGLLAGVAVIALWARAGRVILLVVTGALLSAATPATDAVHAIASTRLTPVSAERADLTRVTAEAFRAAPLTGVGPGQLDLRYVDHAGEHVRAVHAHDEYLQTAAETGLVGLGLALAGAAAPAVAAVRRRTRQGVAAAALLAAFGVHSALDFLWHIPVLPLLLVAAVVCLTTDAHPDERRDRGTETKAGRRGRSDPDIEWPAGRVGRGRERGGEPGEPAGRGAEPAPRRP